MAVEEASDESGGPAAIPLAEALARRRTTLVSIAAAALLVALKLGTGIAAGSLALVGAGIESSGDILAALLTFFAVRLAGRPADPDHPYGHRRAENLAAIGEAAILIAAGIAVSAEAITRLVNGNDKPESGWYVFAVIAVVLVVDISRTAVSVRVARRYRSPALRSNAYHFGSDAIGSVAVLIGLLAVSAGSRVADPIAALIVAAIVFAAAIRLIGENANVLMDRAPEEAQGRAQAAIDALSPSVQLRRLRVRESAGRYFADAVVTVPPGQAVVEGHAAADQVEAAVQRALPESDVVVHVEPRRRGLGLRERVLAAALSEPLVLEAHDITIYEESSGAIVTLHIKLPPELSVAEAHEVAERVEVAICANRAVEAVLTHLEPLELPVAAEPATGPSDLGLAERIRALVVAQLGSPARSLRLITSDKGIVVFLTVGAGANASLSEAHRAASELEEKLRRREPSLAEVVVHTEP